MVFNFIKHLESVNNLHQIVLPINLDKIGFKGEFCVHPIKALNNLCFPLRKVPRYCPISYQNGLSLPNIARLKSSPVSSDGALTTRFARRCLLNASTATCLSKVSDSLPASDSIIHLYHTHFLKCLSINCKISFLNCSLENFSAFLIQSSALKLFELLKR